MPNGQTNDRIEIPKTGRAVNEILGIEWLRSFQKMYFQRQPLG